LRCNNLGKFRQGKTQVQQHSSTSKLSEGCDIAVGKEALHICATGIRRQSLLIFCPVKRERNLTRRIKATRMAEVLLTGRQIYWYKSFLNSYKLILL